MAIANHSRGNQKESWKPYIFEGIPKSQQHIEVSDLGRVRSNSRVSNGAILKGSLTEGYRKISLRYIRPRSSAGQSQFLKDKAALSSEAVALKEAARKLAALKKKKAPAATVEAEKLKRKKIQFGERTAAYKKMIKQEERSRTSYPGALVHRMVATAFCRRPSPKYSYVIHLDHNRMNNRASNLAWATKEQMEAHQQKSPHVKAAKKAMVGVRVGSYALNESRVKAIKRLLANGSKTKDAIAKQFGISSTQVKRIERGENWGDVKI